MALKIAVLAKQVIDPEMPMAAFRVDSEANKVVTPPNIPPVVNGFDENAVEAALLLKDAQEATITVISSGTEFALDVMKKPLSMGADELILLQDPAFEGGDAFSTAQALAAAATKVGEYDLIVCGTQAGDWDNGQVGPYIAAALDIPCITGVGRMEVSDGKVRGERTIGDVRMTVEASLPALVTAGNDVGKARYPKLRDIMAAGRKQPQVWSVQDLGVDPSMLGAAGALTKVRRLYVEERAGECEIIEGETPAEAGENLALRLRELRII